MTKKRLCSMSYTDLSKIVEWGKIDVPRNADKALLAELILVALEDEKLDRESTENLLVQIEAKKFSVGEEDEVFPDFNRDGGLPSRYGETLLVLMIRDPSWVFCYWDMENNYLKSLELNSLYEGLLLRVTELSSPSWGSDSHLEGFDISIQFSDLRRYINLPSEDSFYGAELISLMGGSETVITRSNIIENSRDNIAVPRHDDARRDQLIAISEFSTDTDSSRLFNADSINPQKIL